MLVDYSGCRHVKDQEILQALEAVWGKNSHRSSAIFKEIWANFHAPIPYLIAYADRWHTFTVEGALRLAGIQMTVHK